MINQVDTKDAMIIEKKDEIKLHSSSTDKEITQKLKNKLNGVIYVPESDEFYVYDGKIWKSEHKKRLQSEALKVLYEIDIGRKATQTKASQIIAHLELVSHIEREREVNDKETI